MAAATGAHPSLHASDPPRHAAQPRILRVLAAAQVLGSLGIGAATAMGAVIAYQITDDEALAGISRTIALLATAAFGVPLALLAVRRGRRTSLGLGWSLATVGALVQIAAITQRSLILLVVGLVLFGAAQAGNLQSRFAAIDLEEPRRRTSSLSLVVWATTVGIVLGPNLAAPGESVARPLGLPPIAGIYVIAAVALAATAAVIITALRPDPLLTAQRLERETTDRPAAAPGRTPAVIRAIWSRPRSRFAFVAVVLNHMVMVTVMTMSAVHLHTHGHGLKLIGLMISLHTLGMFAFSPVVGRLADAIGTVRCVVIGQAINAAALACCFFAGPSMEVTTLGLFLLGLGWSFGMVAGSSLLSSAVDPAVRTQAQGTTDTVMSFFAALGAGVAGPVQATWGFAWLAVVSLCCLLPIVALAVRTPGEPAPR
ncbi:MFS transporter [Mariniluteicoccus flavus]